MSQNSGDYQVEGGGAGARMFKQARRRAFMSDLMGRITGRNTDLLSFYDIKEQLNLTNERYLGLQEVPLDKIVGSVGRYHDFNREFLPRTDSLGDRWKRVEASRHRRGMTPVDLYKVGDVYFVLDGNHRVSIGRQEGAETIAAYVTEFDTPVDLSSSDSPNAILDKSERVRFLGATGLDESRPDHGVRTTVPGRYRSLLVHIEQHRQEIQRSLGHPVSTKEAAVDWYDHTYLPIIQLVEEHGILERFTDRTATDLFVWTLRNWTELRDVYYPMVDPDDVDQPEPRMVDHLRRMGWICMVRTNTTSQALRAARLAVEAGVPAVAISLTVPGAVQVIEDLVDQLTRERTQPEEPLRCIIGAASVLRNEQAEASLEAGARFILAPIFAPELISICHEMGAYCAVGSVTPTEIYGASQSGADGVLLFPAVDSGGVSYLRRIHEQMPGVPLVAHGGLSLEDVTPYWEAGVSIVVLGSALLPDTQIERGDWDGVADSLRRAMESMPVKQRR